MPKRSTAEKPADLVQGPEKVTRKTERSHEENQERAYIAASRRADRSIEARVQSARMASEIHKKRTGKGFRITEEIVTKEEMYEEEEDEFPRSYRLLGPSMQTPSNEMNSRVEAYLTNRMAMSALVTRAQQDWQQNHINTLFAQQFPNIGKQAQQLSPTGSHFPGQTSPLSPQAPMSPTFQSINYGHETMHERSRSASTIPPSPAQSVQHEGPASPIMGMAPKLGNESFSPIARTTPSLSSNSTHPAISQPSSFDFGAPQSAFTAELPPEARMLMGSFDMTSTFEQGYYGQDFFGAQLDPTGAQRMKMGQLDTPNSFYPELHKWDSLTQQMPETDAPQPLEEPSWDSFLNDSVWGTDQDQQV